MKTSFWFHWILIQDLPESSKFKYHLRLSASAPVAKTSQQLHQKLEKSDLEQTGLRTTNVKQMNVSMSQMSCISAKRNKVRSATSNHFLRATA